MVSLTFDPVTSTQVNILMSNDVQVGGFQFDINGVTLTSTSGGSAEENGFSVSLSENRIIGFSITGSTIPIGEEIVLTTLIFVEPVENINVCFNAICWEEDEEGFSDCVISDSDGVAIVTSLGDCFDFSGCIDPLACNTSTYAIFDDLNCNYDCLDCAGVDGGQAYQNECGTCFCNGSVAEEGFTCIDAESCIQGCDLTWYNNGGEPSFDDCGICGGEGTSCLPVSIDFIDVSILDSIFSIQLTNYQTIINISFILSGITDIELLSNNNSFNIPTIIDTLISISNGSLAPGTHTLFSIKYIPLTATSCISEVSIFGDGIDAIDVEIGECADIAIIGCTDEISCNYDLNATLSSDDCTYPIDNYECDGSCTGDLIEDECDICGGPGPIENYDCDGDCQLDFDNCGICGGNNSHCQESVSNYLLLSRISTLPDEGEFITIKNTSDVDVSLINHYISDDKEYYKIQSEAKTEVNFNDFITRFPDDSQIDAGDSINICLSTQYTSFFPSSFDCDYILQEDLENIFTEGNSFGESEGERLSESQEMIVLFYWDGDLNHPVRDIDYFVWGSQSGAMDKADTPLYYTETLPEEQDIYVETLSTYYTYVRVSNDELETEGLNGYLGQDETSEEFNTTWEIQPISEFIFGCTNSDSPNYNSNANADDGSCVLTFLSVIDNCLEEEIECSGKYDLTSSNQCPLYGESVTIMGTVVDFYDITPSNGPYSFKLEDSDGYRISFVVWPTSSTYQDGFDILQSDLNFLTQAPYNQYVIEITGKLDVYCSNETQLNIYSDWQIVVEYESDLIILENLSITGDWIEPNTSIEHISISPAPFVIIPTRGETLDYSFTVLDNTRAIVRIFDLSGRFITSLVDDYYIKSGILSHERDGNAWDGRDQLGQIVSPGTYIMHLEVFNPATGETQTDAAPIVVGVEN